jgi:hypothetical protein
MDELIKNLEITEKDYMDEADKIHQTYEFE